MKNLQPGARNESNSKPRVQRETTGRFNAGTGLHPTGLVFRVQWKDGSRPKGCLYRLSLSLSRSLARSLSPSIPPYHCLSPALSLSRTHVLALSFSLFLSVLCLLCGCVSVPSQGHSHTHTHTHTHGVSSQGHSPRQFPQSKSLSYLPKTFVSIISLSLSLTLRVSLCLSHSVCAGRTVAVVSIFLQGHTHTHAFGLF
jgi:hypothetical protein